MPSIYFLELQKLVGFVDATPLVRTLSDKKFTEDIAKIKFIYQLASDSFEELIKTLKAGQSERKNSVAY